ncbi:STAS domain-containing protein [Magnetococcus sp. PR-3]|uniref:STAS domain-containing protein n=1 Tax=Magnetococcus sp. PR-3 TaxID=3120355 RepID=UPI002FCDEBA3
MSITTEKNGNLYTISILGDLNHTRLQDFRMAYQSAPPGSRFRVNLDKVEHIDSSGFGMLLVLKERCENIKEGLTLLNPNDAVRKLLLAMQLDKQVTIK